MKKNTVFGGILMLIIISLICIALTISIALLVGTIEWELFDFKNLNISNMIPIFIIGGIISCFIIGIAVLFLGRTVFFKVKDYLSETDKNKKEKE